MSRRKEPAIPNELLDQLLAGGAASAAFEQGGLLDSLKKALTERALNAEMDHHLATGEGAGNVRNGYGRKTVTTETGVARRKVLESWTRQPGALDRSFIADDQLARRGGGAA